ncbi:MAG: hypothetical protein AB1646_19125 [Thermodesulfobacteriota bacterium]
MCRAAIIRTCMIVLCAFLVGVQVYAAMRSSCLSTKAGCMCCPGNLEHVVDASHQAGLHLGAVDWFELLSLGYVCGTPLGQKGTLQNGQERRAPADPSAASDPLDNGCSGKGCCQGCQALIFLTNAYHTAFSPGAAPALPKLTSHVPLPGFPASLFRPPQS